MLAQIGTILWAQWRSIRNRLPKTSFGSILVVFIALAWYGVFTFWAFVFVQGLPLVPSNRLQPNVARACLGILAYWQLFPIVTVNTGWTLAWNKLVIYPIKRQSLFAINLVLCLTAAPEAVIVLGGLIIGAYRHHSVHTLAPLWLVLYLPINLLLLLALRNFLERVSRRKRHRELIGLAFISLSLLPSVLSSTRVGGWIPSVFLKSANWLGTPWDAMSRLAIGHFSWLSFLSILLACVLSYVFAQWQFNSSLAQDHLSSGAPAKRNRRLRSSFEALGRLLPDPAGALLQKELQSLFRSPRFRVILVMACLFGLVLFLPIALNSSDGKGFLANNFFPLTNLYGVILLGEVLMWNYFGFDARAAQLYFVSPIRFADVVRVKNIIAAMFIALQSILVSSLSALVGMRQSADGLLAGLLATIVAALVFIGCGNLTSVLFPRVVDPNQTFGGQGGGKKQAWLLLGWVGLAIPLGLAFLAQWTFSSTWAMIVVLAIDLAVAAIFYEIATQSAIARGWKRREEIVAALSKETSPISS